MSEVSLFAAALEKTTPEERAAYLAEACAGDDLLRRRVEALLRAHSGADEILDRPAAQPFTGPYLPINEVPGTIIAGKYKLLQQIGEGGMGSVWMADQTEPVKRRVAVKLIRAERDGSRSILSRFEAERQAIALMDHPHIAKLLDAGAVDTRPFFVMELVKGVPLNKFCDQHKLAIADRLTLFVQICSAVQHAHQKGIIHRDLKPSNILVESHDGKPVPKVIDFGLAKAMSGQPLTEHTLFTALGTVAGTPLYMAPEQAAFNAIDVDTRADIYALGVILYELLTGSTPIEREQLRKVAFDEILRVIRESEPPTPSKRLSTSEASPSVAANRQMEPTKLGRFLRGDLDWIVMKALAKERDRRYETANGFAKDVERFLSHEPVLAGPPSAAYKLRKFVRRNRPQVIAASLVLLALIAGMAGTIFGLIRAEQQREIAEAKQKDAENEKANANAATAEAIAEREKAKRAEADTLAAYQASTDEAITQLIGSKEELGPQERAYLENTLKRWQAFAARQGDDERSLAIRSEGHSRVGRIWSRLGRKEEARQEYQAARDIRKKLVEQFPTVTKHLFGLSSAHKSLADVLHGLGETGAALVEYQAARDLQMKLTTRYPDVPENQETLAAIHLNLALSLSRLGEKEKAVAEYLAARNILEKLAAQHPGVPRHLGDLASTHNSLAIEFNTLRKRQESRAAFEAALDIRKKLAAQFPDVPSYQQALAGSLSNWAKVLYARGEREEAWARFLAAQGIYKKLVEQFPALPAHKIDLGVSYYNYGEKLGVEDKLEESLHWFDLAIRTLTPVLDQEPRATKVRHFLCGSYYYRAIAYERLNRRADSIKEWNRVIELSPPRERPMHRACRAISQLYLDKVEEAMADVADLMNKPNATAEDCYVLACFHAVASDKIADKKQEYADRAMELLHKAVKAGYKDAAHMKKDFDLDPLRQRQDFKELLAEVEHRSAPKLPPDKQP